MREQSGIIGGSPDTASHAVVGIVIGGGTLCTGSLIAPNLVLTARHCVADSGDQNGAIECGVSMFSPNYDEGDFDVTWDADLRDGIPGNTVYGVREIRTPAPTSVCGNDIALLILDENVDDSVAVPLEPRINDAVETDETFDAVGYGIQDPNDDRGETAGVRKRAGGNTILCVGEDECRGTGATDTEWLAEAHICQGDSGGPGLDHEGRVIGVTSRSDAECSAGLYTGVTGFKTLIVQAAIDAAAIGGYDPPEWAGGAPPPLDGGVPMDAGTPTDAGTPDSGTPDAGSPDSGTPDSGTPTDAGTPDSGIPDAGRPDSGAPDSGSAGRPPVDSGTPPSTPGALGACVPEEDDDDDDNEKSASCSCSLRPVESSADRLWGTLATAAVGIVVLRRRRRA